jgi:hypothetical protein
MSGPLQPAGPPVAMPPPATENPESNPFLNGASSANPPPNSGNYTAPAKENNGPFPGSIMVCTNNICSLAPAPNSPNSSNQTSVAASKNAVIPSSTYFYSTSSNTFGTGQTLTLNQRAALQTVKSIAATVTTRQLPSPSAAAQTQEPTLSSRPTAPPVSTNQSGTPTKIPLVLSQPATPTYTFSLTAYGTVGVLQNGRLIATTTPQLAQQYGYQPSNPVVVPSVGAANPGGISLSMAAAMRMPLDLDLDGTYFKDGHIVLMGRRNAGHEMDAALFLTALRASCETEDPYFSLDPDDGKAWTEEGNELATALWQRIRGHFGGNGRAVPRNLAEAFTVQAFSASQDYPSLWRELAAKRQNLKARLVFRPQWLRQTRFGEILYRADVLLKELAAGVPAVEQGHGLRAAQVDRYVSANARAASKALLSIVQQQSLADDGNTAQGYRLWFDLVAQPAGPRVPSAPSHVDLGTPKREFEAASKLHGFLRAAGYFGTPEISDRKIEIMSDGDVLDLSQIYPRMFVRLHDVTKGADVEGNDQNLDELSRDVNGRIDLYASAYSELRALVEVFRAYVVAIHISKQDAAVCRKIQSIPLLNAERTSSPLPEFHPTEIFFAIAKYTYSSGGQIFQPAVNRGTISGGISLRGRLFYETTMQTGRQTAVTENLKTEVSFPTQRAVWVGNNGRQFIALTIDSGDLLAEGAKLSAFQTGTPDEVLSRQDAARRAIQARERLQEAADRAQEARLHAEREARQEAERREREEERQAVEVAEREWQRTEQTAAEEKGRQILFEAFGPPIDPTTANAMLQYAVVARDVYSESGGDVRIASVKRVADWEQVLRKAGYSDGRVRALKDSNFFAAIYQNERTGEIIIGYRGLQAQTNAAAASAVEQIGSADIQYKAAADLAWFVKADWPSTPISLTGHAFGGAIAVFAAEQIGMTKVITFNAQRFPTFTRGLNQKWVNIAWFDSRDAR